MYIRPSSWITGFAAAMIIVAVAFAEEEGTGGSVVVAVEDCTTATCVTATQYEGLNKRVDDAVKCWHLRTRNKAACERTKKHAIATAERLIDN